jgi:hypothetical protein
MSLEGKPQADVKAFPLSPGETLVGEIEMLVNNIVDAAQRNADDHASGLQKYAICAYYPQEPQYKPQKVFRVAAEDLVDSGSVEPSEPPTDKGLLSQLMRHNEVNLRQSTQVTCFLFDVMRKEMSRLHEKDERNEQQRMDMIQVQQGMMNETHSRILREREAEAGIALREGLFDQIKAIAPVIMNRIAGKQILPEEDKSFLLTGSFLESLSDEQQNFLRNTLSGPQTALLAEILGEYEKKKASYSSKKEPGLLERGKNMSSPNPTPPKIFSSLRDRMESDEVPKSERTKELEDRGAKFMDRFSGFLEKPTTGEKK